MCNILTGQKKTFSTRIATDSKDLVHLVNARHPKPTEKNDIFAINKIREKVGVVPLEAMKGAIRSISSMMGKDCKVEHIPGNTNPSDALTKSANRESLRTLLDIVQKNIKNDSPRTP